MNAPTKKAPVILISSNDYTTQYPTVMEAITASLIAGSVASQAKPSVQLPA